MRELHDIERSLLDDDGSSRDVTFEDSTWTGVEEMLRSLEGSFGDVSGTDRDARPIAPPLGEATLAPARDRGHVHLTLDGGTGLLRRLQVFVCSNDDGSPFVELTFFPGDVERTLSLRRDFLAWANQIQKCLRAHRYYARYENASWELGDTGPNSGVFLASDAG